MEISIFYIVEWLYKKSLLLRYLFLQKKNKFTIQPIFLNSNSFSFLFSDQYSYKITLYVFSGILVSDVKSN